MAIFNHFFPFSSITYQINYNNREISLCTVVRLHTDNLTGLEGVRWTTDNVIRALHQVNRQPK